jgi:hypothetical protein
VNRGICSQEELTAVIGWVRDSTDKLRQLAAIKTLTAAITRPPYGPSQATTLNTPHTEFSLSLFLSSF